MLVFLCTYCIYRLNIYGHFCLVKYPSVCKIDLSFKILHFFVVCIKDRSIPIFSMHINSTTQIIKSNLILLFARS